jgi:hypothetical protein
METFDLIDELLELTLACQRPDATAEERARLERLLADNPEAISWYLRIVDDTLTLVDAAAAQESTATVTQSLACGPPAVALSSRESAARTGKPSEFRPWWIAAMAIACTIIVAVVSPRFWQSMRQPAIDAALAVDHQAARVVEVSNVEWAEGAVRFNEWTLIRPGDSLRIKSGGINLFLSGGGELLIQGPADVRYISPQRVFARQGKLAARIGPGAIGFRVQTPHANVIDRGTSFGVSVDGERHTSVVVYQGIVDLDVLSGSEHPQRRLAAGEGLSVDGNGQLSRITTVESAEFLEPPKVQLASDQTGRLITTVSDNVQSLKTAKYYRVMPHGFREDCQAYVDRMHEWNGIDRRGLPPFLLGGDYVMTYNDDKIASEIEIAVTLSQPANVFVLIDDRISPPEWLKRGFEDTNWDVGSDEGWGDRIIDVAAGPGRSVEHVFSVWRRHVPEPTTVILGAVSHESPPPAIDIERSMYGVVVTPLSQAIGKVPDPSD